MLEEFHHCALKKNPAIRLVPVVMSGGWIDIDPRPVKEAVVADEKNVDRRTWQLPVVNIIRDVFETERDQAVSRYWIWLKAKAGEIDNAVTRHNDTYRDAEFPEGHRKCADHIAQSAHFGERNALTGGHDDLK